MMPSSLGLLPFAAVKFIGYTLAASYIEKRYAAPAAGRREPRPSLHAQPTVMPVVFDLARTVVGVASGVAVTIGLLPAVADMGPGVIFAILAPLRFVEWALLIWWFYERQRPRGFVTKLAFLGLLLSYLLDVPAWAAWLIMPGQFFWC